MLSIIAIGDELLIGQVIDTNSGDIARMITPAGWRVNDVQVVGDNADDITRAIDRAFESSDIVITTGGIGPTKDDITKTTLCQYFGGEMVKDLSVLQNVKEVVERRGIKLNELTANQAIVPSSCRVIQNRVGTAPIMWFERNGKILVSMPGVPFETKHMFREEVFPQLLERYPSDMAIEHRTMLVTGLTESALAMMLDNWENSLPEHLHLAYLPKPGLIRLRLDGMHHDKKFLSQDIDLHFAQLSQIIGENVLHLNDAEPQEILLEHLNRLSLTVSTAESCTGGNIAHLITSIAGSSSAFMGSIVAYSNDVKHRLLGVNKETLDQHGAVSIPTVEQMAEGACENIGTDCSIVTSGIAGPTGGTPDKPVGTVCIAVKSPLGIASHTHRFPGDRSRVIERASTTAIIMLIEQLKKLDAPK